MTFNLTALFSGLVYASQQSETTALTTPAPALREQLALKDEARQTTPALALRRKLWTPADPVPGYTEVLRRVDVGCGAGGCLDGNRPQFSREAAEARCSVVQGCALISRWPPHGYFYLRRNTDPQRPWTAEVVTYAKLATLSLPGFTLLNRVVSACPHNRHSACINGNCGYITQSQALHQCTRLGSQCGGIMCYTDLKWYVRRHSDPRYQTHENIAFLVKHAAQATGSRCGINAECRSKRCSSNSGYGLGHCC